MLDNAAPRRQARVLGKVGNFGSWLHEALAAIDINFTGKGAHQGRFAAAVTANETGPLASRDTDIKGVENDLISIAQMS
jgi:hypothetical protein